MDKKVNKPQLIQIQPQKQIALAIPRYTFERKFKNLSRKSVKLNIIKSSAPNSSSTQWAKSNYSNITRAKSNPK